MKIKEMRQNFGYTQKQFSEITGIPKRTIEDWETEKLHPPEWLPKMIECYLNTKTQDVKGKDDEEK